MLLSAVCFGRCNRDAISVVAAPQG